MTDKEFTTQLKSFFKDFDNSYKFCRTRKFLKNLKKFTKRGAGGFVYQTDIQNVVINEDGVSPLIQVGFGAKNLTDD